MKRLLGLQICGLGSKNFEEKGGLCFLQTPSGKKKEMATSYARLCLVVFVGLLLDVFDDGGGVDWDKIMEYIWIIVIMGLLMVQGQLRVSLYLTVQIMGVNP